MNEWVPVKGCLYWGYGQMDLVGSILLLFRPCIGYDYSVIQVLCWVKLLEQRRLCPIFVTIWIPIMGHNSMVSGLPKSTEIPRVDGLSTGPLDLGCHSLVSELRLTIT